MATKKGGRNYKKEYANYHSKAGPKKKRACNNAANRKMKKDGKIKKGSGKDVAHKNNKTCDNRKKNLKVASKKSNRSYPRTKTARRKKT